MKTAYISDGGLFKTGDVPVKHPCILVDGEYDILICWGERRDMQARLAATKSLYNVYGWRNHLSVIDLSPMPAEMALYAIRRGTDCIDSDFIQELFNRQKDSGIQNWLEKEMEKVPIPLGQ